MDNMGMDPELASETVKLFAQELKIVRAQLREAEKRASTTPCTGGPSNNLIREGEQALIAENGSLKADNTTFKEWVARLQNELGQLSSVKSEEDAEMSMSRTSGEFARLLAENEDLIREKEEASRNQEKLSTLQEKYRRTKDTIREYNEILKELTQELEQSRRAVVSEIDLKDFLNFLPYEPVEDQLKLSSIPPYTRCGTKLHKSVMDVCYGPYFINHNEVIWSPSGIALGLVIEPTFQYNPKTQGGTWTKVEDDFEIGKHMDVCCLSGKTARYLGTYERIEQGTMVISPETLKDLDPNTQMITNMYKQGVIKLQCFWIRRIAFNKTFAEKLQEFTSEDVGKRKRDPKSTVHSNRSKKRKH